jgi:hypothetical protein
MERSVNLAAKILASSIPVARRATLAHDHDPNPDL